MSLLAAGGGELGLGPGLLIAVALGIACYGLLCFAKARHLGAAAVDH